MDNAGYTTLNRQAGLMQEMRAIANNIANVSTTGFRKEGVVFAEHLARLGADEPTLAMADGVARVTDLRSGPLLPTGGALDLAIEGDGFFLLATAEGERLSRAGSFALSPEGELVAADGARLLDAGGATITIPPGAGQPAIARDGTLSVGGTPVAQIGLYATADMASLIHDGGTRFAVTGPMEPVEAPRIHQGFLEGSNVEPVREIARMIEVQRAYEMGQGFLDREDGRIRAVIETLGR
ncbi:flagellar hook-basal body complex protein [Defluviimonas sp. WL0075]|uniref:Flagellar hook-basal body complex protein n=1 Tax=Albidovulum sediminicola TaxID=2984331 RepID=A0ABT2Z4K9_9RHOB|nr:flagellar hook-basal body complex protein [Defluviimonas sp. WL0075]MCV2866084.1 flagellar hook-basal body complex protein [Defluviimonas sp. WL0075]